MALYNVLAYLSEWAITNETRARVIAATFGDALPARTAAVRDRP